MTAREVAHLALVGAGGAGLSVLHHLALSIQREPDTWRYLYGSPLHVKVFDPVNRLVEPVYDRTWCWWTTDLDPWREIAHMQWLNLQVVDAAGQRVPVPLAPYRYLMVRSDDYHRHLRSLLAQVDNQLTVEWLPAASNISQDTKHGFVDIHTDHGTHRARWVLDSRPDAAKSGKEVGPGLVQHFMGHTVHADRDLFDPGHATLMDFSVPQTPGAVCFGYYLPWTTRDALIEFTVLSAQPWPDAAYEPGMQACYQACGIDAAHVQVVHREAGAIAMQVRQPSPGSPAARVFEIGTLGGAVRPSTGYAFASMQRQAVTAVTHLAQGHPPRPGRTMPLRHRWMDAVLMQALADTPHLGPTIFARLFKTVPAPTIFRVLDGLSSVVDELRFLQGPPPGVMTAAAARLLLDSGRDRGT